MRVGVGVKVYAYVSVAGMGWGVGVGGGGACACRCVRKQWPRGSHAHTLSLTRSQPCSERRVSLGANSATAAGCTVWPHVRSASVRRGSRCSADPEPMSPQDRRDSTWSAGRVCVCVVWGASLES